MTATRGTTNGNVRWNTDYRRRRREWLIETYRADVDAAWPSIGPDRQSVEAGHGEPACRCYRCGVLLTVQTVTADRIIPGCKGGTYRRNNIRPACARCNSETGGALARRTA